MKYMSIKQYYESKKHDILKNCTACARCIEVCPNVQAFSLSKKEMHSLSQTLLETLAGEPPSEQVFQWVFGCNHCGLCRKACPQGIDTVLFNKILRHEFLSRRDSRIESVSKYLTEGNFKKTIEILNHLLMKDIPKRWVSEIPEHFEPVDTLVFLGCAGLVRPDISLSLLDMMDKIGKPYTAVGGINFCCGSIFQFIGEVDLFETCLKHMITSLMAFKPKRVLYLCAECMYNAMDTGPHLLDIPFTQEYVTEYLVEHLEKLPFENTQPVTVSFHDSCSLGRLCGDYESPRALLKHIPGLTLVEMQHTRQDGFCCGAPGDAFSPGKSEFLKKMRYQEFQETGAATLITTCTNCEVAYQNWDSPHGMNITNIFPFVAEFLGITRENPLAPFHKSHDVDGVMEKFKEIVKDGRYKEEEYKMVIRKLFGVKT